MISSFSLFCIKSSVDKLVILYVFTFAPLWKPMGIYHFAWSSVLIAKDTLWKHFERGLLVQLKVIHSYAFSASLTALVSVNTHCVETARGQAFPSNSVFLGFQPEVGNQET